MSSLPRRDKRNDFEDLSKMVVVTVRFPEVFVEGLDELVRRRIYSSRSEAIRDAVRRLLKSELGRLG